MVILHTIHNPRIRNVNLIPEISERSNLSYFVVPIPLPQKRGGIERKRWNGREPSTPYSSYTSYYFFLQKKKSFRKTLLSLTSLLLLFHLYLSGRDSPPRVPFPFLMCMFPPNPPHQKYSQISKVRAKDGFGEQRSCRHTSHHIAPSSSYMLVFLLPGGAVVVGRFGKRGEKAIIEFLLKRGRRRESTKKISVGFPHFLHKNRAWK